MRNSGILINIDKVSDNYIPPHTHIHTHIHTQTDRLTYTHICIYILYVYTCLYFKYHLITKCICVCMKRILADILMVTNQLLNFYYKLPTICLLILNRVIKNDFQINA